MSKTVAMPKNWDNHTGWDKFYQAQTNLLPEPLPWSELQNQSSLRFLGFARGLGQKKVWFAGAGRDTVPFIYAYAGCHVLATDVSEAAVRYLSGLPNGINALVEDVEAASAALEIAEPPINPLPVRFMVHDFREPLPEADFDLMLNIKAFQALPELSMRRAADVFFQSLREGGHAIFDTVNVQGERRDQIEGILSAAGFYLPYFEVDQWYRQQLSQTSIPYLLVLGQPFVDRSQGNYKGEKGEERAKQDQETLRGFTSEYRQKREAESEKVTAKLSDASIKVAHVVYNTG